ncbi:MAG: N-acetylneuraminate synthase [Deltaproteobacteria bacterium GWA2_55_10]|nr:MAG: N-acetylneuraminate synthase [Deltaproteobacteria bacterium GWA2_55_10]
MGIFIVAEIGINHNGDVGIAKKLIDVACLAGADAVKFQKRTVDAVYTGEELDKPRESPWGATNRALKERLEFGSDEYREIDAYCKEKKIEWFASAWDLESQRFLRQFNLNYNKVASAVLDKLDLLHLVAEERKYTFVSTGMSSFDEIDAAVEVFRKHRCPFELMHCTSTYPTDDEKVNLKAIETLRDRYKCRVGYSGHEVGLAVSYGAAALGITSLERHITLDRAMFGSDQAASVAPMGFMQLCGAVRKIEKALGDGVKRVLDEELPIRKKLRGY